MISQQKLRTIIHYLKVSPATLPERCDEVSLLLGDLEFISDEIKNAGRQLENCFMVIPSLVQIIDGRKESAATANTSRLTVLALVFVPLNFVSSLFSMNSSNLPGSPHFWVYFAVAVPFTVIIYLIAHPLMGNGVRRTYSSARALSRRVVRNLWQLARAQQEGFNV